jgi:hypothetical protein
LAKAFFAFFALASADLCDFSAFALAAVATSKALRQALSLASSDAMRALADAEASAVQQRKERRSQTKSKEKHTRQAKIGQRINLRKLSQPSSIQYIQYPRQRISSSMPAKGGTHKYMEGARKIKYSATTHIVRGACGLVCFKENFSLLGFLRPLGTLGRSNLLGRSSSGPCRLHSWLSLLYGRLISNYILGIRSSRSIPFRLLVITARGNRFSTTRKEESKYNKTVETRRTLTMP